jgi:hypothetical protein
MMGVTLLLAYSSTLTPDEAVECKLKSQVLVSFFIPFDGISFFKCKNF